MVLAYPCQQGLLSCRLEVLCKAFSVRSEELDAVTANECWAAGSQPGLSDHASSG